MMSYIHNTLGTVHVKDVDGDPFFKGSDVSEICGVPVKDDYVSDFDFFELADKSPRVKEIRRWLTHEILPDFHLGYETEKTVGLAVEALKQVPVVYWCAVCHIPWLKKIFNMNAHATKEITTRLFLLSDELNIGARRLDDEWLFHSDVIRTFHKKIMKDKKMLGKYRLA